MDCEYFGRCGGCTYLDIPYEKELELKLESLRETLGEYGNLIDSVLPSPVTEGYRNKMELAFGDDGKDGNLALGIRKKRSFYEVAIPDKCILIPEDFKKITMYVLNYFRESKEAFFHRKRHIGTLRHLVLRRGTFTGELLIILSTTSGVGSLTPLIEGLRQLPLEGQLVGFLHSINEGVADAVKSENTQLLWGRDYYNEELSGLKFKVSAFSFFQTNVAGAEELYSIVRDFATTTPANLVYDLYCGTGTISQIISPQFKKVVGIELIEDAIKAARENAELNGIDNCEFYAGDVGSVLDKDNPDVVIVDPPRDGLHPKALPQIVKLNAARLIYVACKPKSLARDIAILAESDYIPDKIVSIDMFPRTPHVECVCLMVRR